MPPSLGKGKLEVPSQKLLMKLFTEEIHQSFFSQRDDTIVTWLGSAGALINARGTVLMIDPVIAAAQRDGQQLAETGHRLKVPLPIEAEQIPRADAVLYTHADGDHFGQKTAEILDRRLKPTFIAPPPVRAGLEGISVSRDRIIIAQDYASIRVGKAEIMVTPAIHDWQEKDPWQRGDCCGYIVKTGDGAIWHPGDTRLFDELLKVRNVDVLFFDVAVCRSHLGPEGSARLAGTCGAKVLVAYHYGTFDVPTGGPFGSDPEDCLPLVEGLSARYLMPNPGQLLRLSNL